MTRLVCGGYPWLSRSYWWRQPPPSFARKALTVLVLLLRGLRASPIATHKPCAWRVDRAAVGDLVVDAHELVTTATAAPIQLDLERIGAAAVLRLVGLRAWRRRCLRRQSLVTP